MMVEVSGVQFPGDAPTRPIVLELELAGSIKPNDSVPNPGLPRRKPHLQNDACKMADELACDGQRPDAVVIGAKLRVRKLIHG